MPYGIIFEMDSWYTCKRLWDKALEKGITLIGAMKTNRILYPGGHRRSAQDYAAMLPNGQYHLVTVGGHEYWIHRYEGALNGIDKAVVLLSYPKNVFGKKNALLVFISSDLELSDAEILIHYNHHADRNTVCTNRNERVQTNGCLSYKIRLRGKQTTTHGDESRRLLSKVKSSITISDRITFSSTNKWRF